MASFSRLSFSSYSFGGFSIDFEAPPITGLLSPLAIAVQGIGFGALFTAVHGFYALESAFIPTPWRTYKVISDARLLVVGRDARTILPTA